MGPTSKALEHPCGLVGGGAAAALRTTVTMVPALPVGSPACDVIPAVTFTFFYLVGTWTHTELKARAGGLSSVPTLTPLAQAAPLDPTAWQGPLEEYAQPLGAD